MSAQSDGAGRRLSKVALLLALLAAAGLMVAAGACPLVLATGLAAKTWSQNLAACRCSWLKRL